MSFKDELGSTKFFDSENTLNDDGKSYDSRNANLVAISTTPKIDTELGPPEFSDIEEDFLPNDNPQGYEHFQYYMNEIHQQSDNDTTVEIINMPTIRRNHKSYRTFIIRYFKRCIRIKKPKSYSESYFDKLTAENKSFIFFGSYQKEGRSFQKIKYGKNLKKVMERKNSFKKNYFSKTFNPIWRANR